ncbi:MAG: DUF2169 domain-containing protein [Polyangiaceae bacterium]
MDVVSLSPVPVASLLWRREGCAWRLSVISKLTFKVIVGESVLSKEHIPLHFADECTLEGDLHAPCDVVPTRPAVDVMIVGRAYRGRDAKTEKVSPRLRVGTIDRQLKMTVDRSAGAGLSLPRGEAGFGPQRDFALRIEAKNEPCEVEADSDLSVFHAAPPEQRVDHLPADAELILDGLHPEHASLRTRLPNVSPQMFVERPGVPREELDVSVEALWIDTERHVITLTYRGTVVLSEADEPGKCWVAMAGEHRRMSDLHLERYIGSLRGQRSTMAEDPSESDYEPTVKATKKPSGRPSKEHTQTRLLEDADFEVLDEATVADDGDPPWRQDRTGDVLPSPPSEAPVWLAPGYVPEPTQSVATAVGLGGAEHLGFGPRADTLPSGELANVSPWASPKSTMPSGGRRSSPPASSSPSPPPVSSLRRSDGTALSDPEPSEKPRLSSSTMSQRGRSVVELLWFDEAGTAKLRARWPQRSSELEFTPLDPQHDLVDEDPERARAHHTHFGLMMSGAAVDLSELATLMRDAVDERGRFSPPIALVEGRLQLPFDPNKALRALVDSVRPLIGSDEKMVALLKQAGVLLDSPWAGGSEEAVSNMAGRVRKAYGKSRSAVSLAQLDISLERLLLSSRAYQRRKLLGGEWIRGELECAELDETLPAYLPAELSETLPMLRSFRSRLIIEVHARQDQYEPHEIALKTLSLGRVLPL